MQVLNIGTFEDKNSFYYLIYNGKIYIFDICRVLRKVNKFSRQDYNSYEKLIQQAREIFKKIIHQIYIQNNQYVDIWKISANAVNVSLTCNDLNNTGIGQKIGAIVTINGLKRNQKYYFAVAAYDGTEGVSNGIGETGDEITTIHPLPLPLLASYLFKVAYQLSNFDICEDAADFCIMQFTENSEFIDRQLHNELNPIHVKRLLQQRIKSVSLIEIQNLTETLLIKAKCLQKKLRIQELKLRNIQYYYKFATIYYIHQKHHQVVDILQLPKELQPNCIICQNHSSKKNHYKYFIFLLKSQIIIVEIPKQYWDANLRILSAKFTYEILKVCMKLNEITLGRRVNYNRLTENEDAKKDTKKDVKKEGKQQQADEPVQPPKQRIILNEFYCLRLLTRNSIGLNDEFGDYIPSFVEKWKEQINQLIPYMENPSDSIDKIFSDRLIRFISDFRFRK
ncbi:unnamed protein product [Paramecium primaurelia]|uniref:Uncharacterized protein n=1 Tax=Paramecium primaurelia TaxID=5886 RepID=A0A8S1PSB3_PARPR|nr:unnamed protein product [Paramecium primaurelia]